MKSYPWGQDDPLAKPVIQVIPAAPGWYAAYYWPESDTVTYEPLIAWGLVEGGKELIPIKWEGTDTGGYAAEVWERSCIGMRRPPQTDADFRAEAADVIERFRRIEQEQSQHR